MTEATFDGRPIATCSHCGEKTLICLGEAFSGYLKCEVCNWRIELTHEERWATFDYIDDKVDGLFTPEEFVSIPAPQPVDDEI